MGRQRMSSEARRHPTQRSGVPSDEIGGADMLSRRLFLSLEMSQNKKYRSCTGVLTFRSSQYLMNPILPPFQS